MAQFEIGDLLVYSRTGVCRVAGFSNGAAQQCYVLQPLYQTCSITIPVGNTKVFMRPLVSAAEAEALIADLPGMEAEPYYNRNLNQLREHYRGQLDGYSCMSLAMFVLSLYRKRREMLAAGKKFGAVDERFLKEARICSAESWPPRWTPSGTRCASGSPRCSKPNRTEKHVVTRNGIPRVSFYPIYTSALAVMVSSSLPL